MNDQNILRGTFQPAARKLGLPFVNWRCLANQSHATWLIQAGADQNRCKPKCGTRAATTLDIYASNRCQQFSGGRWSNSQRLPAAATILPAEQQTAMDLDSIFRVPATGSGATVQFTVQNGPINGFFKCTRTAQNPASS